MLIVTKFDAKVYISPKIIHDYSINGKVSLISKITGPEGQHRSPIHWNAWNVDFTWKRRQQQHERSAAAAAAAVKAGNSKVNNEESHPAQCSYSVNYFLQLKQD